MSAQTLFCEGAKAALQVSNGVSETIAMLHGVPVAPGSEERIRALMTRLNVGFVDDFDLNPSSIAYECLFDCSKCLGKVALSIKEGVAEVALPTECPDSAKVDILTTEEVDTVLGQVQ